MSIILEVFSVLLMASRVQALTIDVYGGTSQLACPKGAAHHFYTQDISGRWWLCDPAGHGFYFKGVDTVQFNTNSEQLDRIIPGGACTGFETPSHCCTGSGAGPSCGGKYWNSSVNSSPLSAVGPNPACGESSCINSAAHSNPTSWIYNWDVIQLERLKSWGFNAIGDSSSLTNLAPEIVDSNWTTSDHTIPIHVPFDSEVMLASRYAMTNSSGCSISSAIKDLPNGINSTVASNDGVNQGRVWDVPDYFDPNWTTCLKNLLSPANDPVLNALANTSPNSGYFVFAEIDESGQTGWAEAGPDFVQIGGGGVVGNGPPYSTHAGWITLVTSPTQSTTSGKVADWGVTYSNQEVYSKVEFADEMLTRHYCTGSGIPAPCCSGSQTGNCSIDPAVAACSSQSPGTLCYPGQSAISNATAALNTAWGSSYSTLATSDSNCTSNLAACLQNGTYASWGTGTGLLDEDGLQGQAWVGTDPHALSGETAGLQVDLSTFLSNYAKRYFATMKAAYNVAAPGLLLAMDSGDFGSPARREVLQQQGLYMDLLEMTFPIYCVNCTDMQARINFAYKYTQRPWVLDFGFAVANPDSAIAWHPDVGYNGYNNNGDNSALTQKARAAVYQNIINQLVASPYIVGFQWWGWNDMDVQATNWGLLSVWDDPYDGVLATSTPHTDSYGMPSGEQPLDNGYCYANRAPWPCCTGDNTGTCTGVSAPADLGCTGVGQPNVAPYNTCCTGVGTGTCQANYGDYTDAVATANNGIYSVLLMAP